MKLLVKQPGQFPTVKDFNKDNLLAELQAAVGGYIEAIPIATDLVLIADEEGKFKRDKVSKLGDLWRQKMELCQERADKREFVHRYLQPAIVEASDWRIREVLYTVRGDDEVVEFYSDDEMTNLTRRIVVTCDSLAAIMRDVAAVL